MLDNQILYAQMVAEELRRERREQATIGRFDRRVFRLAHRRPVRMVGIR